MLVRVSSCDFVKRLCFVDRLCFIDKWNDPLSHTNKNTNRRRLLEAPIAGKTLTYPGVVRRTKNTGDDLENLILHPK